MNAQPQAERLALIAHRGWPARWPENSLQGFEAAAREGADEVECDVWLSRDGVPVICHDEALDRTSTLRGLITEMPYDALARADLLWPDGSTARGFRIPRLEAVLESCAGRAGLNIEIKDFRHVEVILDRVRRSLGGRSVGDGAPVYVALRPALLAEGARLAGDLPRCALSGPMNAHEQIRLARQYGCQRIQFHRDNCSPEAIAEARHAGLVVNYFWSDDPGEQDRLLAWGVHALLTNDIAKMKRRTSPAHGQRERGGA